MSFKKRVTTATLTACFGFTLVSGCSPLIPSVPKGSGTLSKPGNNASVPIRDEKPSPENTNSAIVLPLTPVPENQWSVSQPSGAPRVVLTPAQVTTLVESGALDVPRQLLAEASVLTTPSASGFARVEWKRSSPPAANALGSLLLSRTMVTGSYVLSAASLSPEQSAAVAAGAGSMEIIVSEASTSLQRAKHRAQVLFEYLLALGGGSTCAPSAAGSPCAEK